MKDNYFSVRSDKLVTPIIVSALEQYITIKVNDDDALTLTLDDSPGSPLSALQSFVASAMPVIQKTIEKIILESKNDRTQINITIAAFTEDLGKDQIAVQ
jgi:hypothetical protein